LTGQFALPELMQSLPQGKEYNRIMDEGYFLLIEF